MPETKKPENNESKGAFDGAIVYQYSRKQAIEDGVLADLSQFSINGPFKFPVAVTETVFNIMQEAVENKQHGNSYQGILADMAATIAIGQQDGNICLFKTIISGVEAGKVFDFKAVCHAGDNGEPVVTIMLPSED